MRTASNMQHYFNLNARNGEVILTSEMYISKAGCLNGIESVKQNSPYDSRYVKKVSTDGQYFFNLKSANGEVIGTSETYHSVQGRDNGIESVKREAPTAKVVDLT